MPAANSVAAMFTMQREREQADHSTAPPSTCMPPASATAVEHAA